MGSSPRSKGPSAKGAREKKRATYLHRLRRPKGGEVREKRAKDVGCRVGGEEGRSSRGGRREYVLQSPLRNEIRRKTKA